MSLNIETKAFNHHEPTSHIGVLYVERERERERERGGGREGGRERERERDRENIIVS